MKPFHFNLCFAGSKQAAAKPERQNNNETPTLPVKPARTESCGCLSSVPGTNPLVIGPSEACQDNEKSFATTACAKVLTKGHVPVIHVNEEVEIVLLGPGIKTRVSVIV